MRNNLSSVIHTFIDLGLKVVPLLGVIALLVFVLGVGKFIRSTKEGKDVEKTKGLLIWGAVGLFVLFTIWGIVTFITSEFGFGNTIGIPQLKQ